MSTVAEIEAAIERLPPAEVEEVAAWLESLRLRRAAPDTFDDWLRRAQGSAKPGVTTDEILRMTRGEE
jgi:hypothetical protein